MEEERGCYHLLLSQVTRCLGLSAGQSAVQNSRGAGRPLPPLLYITILPWVSPFAETNKRQSQLCLFGSEVCSSVYGLAIPLGRVETIARQMLKAWRGQNHMTRVLPCESYAEDIALSPVMKEDGTTSLVTFCIWSKVSHLSMLVLCLRQQNI